MAADINLYGLQNQKLQWQPRKTQQQGLQLPATTQDAKKIKAAVNDK